MPTLKRIAASLAALALCGCQSLTAMAIKALDDKPYSHPLVARALPASQPFVEAPPTAAAVPASPAEAVRTDIRGQGDGAMTDERVVVTAVSREVPHRAPDFSREQVAAMVCAVRTNGGKEDRVKSAVRAYDATVAAYEARTAFDAGTLKLKQTDDAERKRQDAVKAAMGGGMVFGLVGGLSKKADLPKPEQQGIVLENVDLFTFTESGKPVMAVSGIVQNTTDKRAELSPLTLHALDRWEFILAGQTSLLPFEALEAGESRTFEVRFHNPPETAYEVYAHFAPPFEYRMRRECDPLAPAAGAPPVAPHTARAAAALTSPVHTAAELNQLTRVYRAEAQSAWNLRRCALPKEERELQRKPAKPGMSLGADGSGERREGITLSIRAAPPNIDNLCASWTTRAPWRDMFTFAEIADEAWGATLASEELQRQLAASGTTQEEAAAAAGAQREAYRVFRQMGAQMLSRAGAPAPEVAVEIADSKFGYEPVSKMFDGGDISKLGFYVDVAGRIRNTGTSPRKVDALMLAVVDRLEHPLLTYRLPYSAELAPGQTVEFSQRVTFSDPVSRKENSDTPPWQIRVGAIGG